MNIFDKFRHHDDKAQPTEQVPVAPVSAVAPEAIVTAEVASDPSNPAALELARAADELGGIVATETQQTGNLDVAAPTAAVEPPTVAEQVAALDSDTYVTPANETPEVVPQETVTDAVPDVTAMSSDAIHEALNIPPVGAPVEASAAPVAEVQPEPVTPEQPVLNQ